MLKKRYQEFFGLLDSLDRCYELIKSLKDYCRNNSIDVKSSSKRLQEIFETIPDICEITNEFRGRVEQELLRCILQAL